MDLWFYLALIVFGIGLGACAMSPNRTVAIWTGLSLAVTAVTFYSTPWGNEYLVYYVQEVVTNSDVGWIGSLGIIGGIAVINWKDNKWSDGIGIAMILVGALLYTSAGFGNPIIDNLQELVPATRPTLIEAS